MNESLDQLDTLKKEANEAIKLIEFVLQTNNIREYPAALAMVAILQSKKNHDPTLHAFIEAFQQLTSENVEASPEVH